MRRILITAALTFAVIACGAETVSSPTVVPQQEVVVNNVAPPEAKKQCEILRVKQRRDIGGTNIVVFEYDADPEVKDIHLVFKLNGKDILIEKDLPQNTKLEIAVPLECGVDHHVKVYLEGYLEDREIQCDGGVNMRIECEDECVQTERPGDECKWNQYDCEWECKPPPVPECSDAKYWGFEKTNITHSNGSFTVGTSYQVRNGHFRLVLLRHRCSSSLILGEAMNCHPGEWKSSKTFKCVDGIDSEGRIFIQKKESKAYKNWCYTSELYQDGSLVQTRKIR